MSEKKGHSSKRLEEIRTYADQFRVPAWIFDLQSAQLVYCNTFCQFFFKSLQREESTRIQFEASLNEQVEKKLRETTFFITDITIRVGEFSWNLEINVNKVSDRYCVLSLIQLPIVRDKSYDFKTRFFFCEYDGKIIHTDRANKHPILDKVTFIQEVFSPEDQISVNAILNELNRDQDAGKTRYLKEINLDFLGYNQLVDIDFVIPKKGVIAAIFRESHFQNELILERSRAELAEEINEILKLEIEEHKKTQRKLDDTEVLSQSILDSSLNMLITFDNEMRITEFNRKAANFTGFSHNDVLGSDVNTILENDGTIENVIMLVNSVGRYEGELLCLKKSGDKFSVTASVTLLKNKQGVKLGYVCSMRDTTELKAWQSKLAITEERYTDLFENATDLIQGVDTEGKFIYTNKAWYKGLGYSKKEREELTVFDIIHAKDKRAFKQFFNKIIGGAKDETRVWNLLKANGDILIVEANSNLKLADNKPYAVRSIMRDVTEATRAKKQAQEQRAKMEAIIETGKIMFWTVNRAIKLTSFNKEYEKAIGKLYGKKPKLDTSLEGPKDKFAPEEYHKFWNMKYKKVFETGESLFFQTKTTDRFGKTYFREIYLRPITMEGGKVVEVSGMAIDITDKKMNEWKLDQQSAKIQAIFDSTNHAIWSNRISGEITSFNEILKNELKDRYGADIALGKNAFEIAKSIKLRSGIKWNRVLEEVADGRKMQFEVESLDQNNKKYIEDVSISPIYNADGEVTEMAGIAQNVTFKRVAEKKLKEQAAKINAIFNSTAILIWTVDENMRIVAYNKVFADQHFKLLGKEVSIGTNFVELIKAYVSKQGYANLKKYFKAAFKGKSQQFEGVIYSSSGKKVWLENFLNPIYSETNEIKEISCLSYDITEKKRTEEKMIETIHEKEILLQEVHHRVKNNLQVISSILNLQTSYVKDKNSLNILRESQNRIKSMSFIHESLYQNKDFANIEFSEYILSLTKNLIHSYSISTDKISLNTELNRCFLSLDQAIPCGLIANELISNALKYAFENTKDGAIFLGLEENKNTIKLVIGDNGIGLPDDFDYENSETLGLQLVYTLADQLDATIHVEVSNGTKYLITFDKQ